MLKCGGYVHCAGAAFCEIGFSAQSHWDWRLESGVFGVLTECSDWEGGRLGRGPDHGCCSALEPPCVWVVERLMLVLMFFGLLPCAVTLAVTNKIQSRRADLALQDVGTSHPCRTLPTGFPFPLPLP